MMKTKLFILVLMFSVSFVNAQNLFDVVYTNDKHIPAYLSIKEDVRMSLKMRSRSNMEYQVDLMENESIVHYEGISEEDGKSQKTTIEDTEWVLELYDTTSAKPRISWIITGNTANFNTTGWPQGLYVIRAIVNGETLTEKMYINNK